MKSIKISYLVLILCISFVLANSLYLSSITDDLYKMTDEINVYAEGAEAEILELYDFFDKHQKFISITVSHADLMSIDDEFCELIAEIRLKDTKAADITKSRLCGSLRHLKRLSGFNIESII